jgi:hypothetical protein
MLPVKSNFLIILACAAIVVITSSFFRPDLGKGSAANVSLGREPAQQSPTSCLTPNYSGLFDPNSLVGHFEGIEVSIPETLAVEINRNEQVLGVANEEKWIEVSLSEQKLRAWEGDRLFLETAVSTGLPRTPTPKGEFRIWIKLRAAKMSGGEGRNYYYLPNVPYVMYFGNEKVPNWKGYGLHGTYWHNDFGNPRSRGCVNLPTPIAGELYHWVTPELPIGKSVVKSSNENPGTRIVIQD